MGELGDALITMSGTMHIWVRPVVVVLFGVIAGCAELIFAVADWSEKHT